MKKRKLGNLEVNEIGLGCMGMSEFYGKTDDNESLKVLEKSFELGVNFYDTADTYGFGHNEKLLAKFIKGKRDKLVIATKFGIKRKKEKYERVIDNSPEYIRSSCESSLKRLGIDYIDLYYVHRLNNNYKLEETMQTLKDLVKEGKIKHIGLSEVSAKTLEKAHNIFR
jgi:aryl-alcohol dehydrogenase-like predicted oxidoreductase